MKFVARFVEVDGGMPSDGVSTLDHVGNRPDVDTTDISEIGFTRRPSDRDELSDDTRNQIAGRGWR